MGVLSVGCAAATAVSGCSAPADEIGSTSQAQTQGLQLIKDIHAAAGGVAGRYGSAPQGFLSFAGRTFFVARATAGAEKHFFLYASDGTEQGTERITDLGLAPRDNSAPKLAVHLGKLYTTGVDSTEQPTLVESDGTAAGTQIAATVNEAGSGGRIVAPTSTPQGLLFMATGSGFDALLRYAPGQPKAYEILTTKMPLSRERARIVAGPTASLVLPFAGTSPFLTNGQMHGQSFPTDIDGATWAAPLGASQFVVAGPSGTSMESWLAVVDAATGTSTPLPTLQSPGARRGLGISGLAAVGSRVLISGGTSFASPQSPSRLTFQDELWSTDGTAQGTTHLLSAPTDRPTDPVFFTHAAGRLHVIFGSGAGMSTVDGTAQTTIALSAFTSADGAHVASVASDANRVFASYFQESDSPPDLRVLDVGTGQATELRDPSHTLIDARSRELGVGSSGVFFACRVDTGVANFGGEPCAWDGVSTSATLVATLDRSGVPSSDPRYFRAVGQRAYFVADDGAHGEELWVTDGTPQGTHLVKDLAAGVRATAFATPSGRLLDLAIGDTFLFVTEDSIDRKLALWATDGTDASTQKVADLQDATIDHAHGMPAPVRAGAYVYYLRAFADRHVALMRTSGTPGSETELAELVPGGPDAEWPLKSGKVGLRALGDRVIATREAGGRQESLQVIVSDGTAQGTRSLGPLGHFVAAGDDLAYFAAMSASDAATSIQRLDLRTGSVTSVDLPRLNPGSSSSWVRPSSCANVLGGKLIFMARQLTGAVSGGDVWSTDGTAQNTSRIAELGDGNRSCGDFYLPEPGATTQFGAFTVLAASRSIVLSDGTPTGTTEITRPDHKLVRLERVVDGRGVLYRSDDALEMWTPTGTTRIVDDHVSFAGIGGSLITAADALFVSVPVASSSIGFDAKLVRYDWATGQVRDVGGQAHKPRGVTKLGTRVILSAEDANGDRELYAGTISTL